MESVIKALNIKKSYGSLRVLGGVDFFLNNGEIAGIVGPNGCGKTTFLKILSGIEKYDSGSLKVAGDVALIPQDNLLFPWFNIMSNIGLGLKFRGIPGKERQSKVLEISRLLGIEQYLKQYPIHISGGTAKKVAISRALVLNPDVLLLDEPFAGLDVTSVETLIESLKSLKGRISMVVVSHQIDELVEIADRIYFFSHRPAKVTKTLDTRELSQVESRKLVSEFLKGDRAWN